MCDGEFYICVVVLRNWREVRRDSQQAGQSSKEVREKTAFKDACSHTRYLGKWYNFSLLNTCLHSYAMEEKMDPLDCHCVICALVRM